ncbi:hypothetical protein BS329_20995 [Amycolatopsis coloradensis]|uniref:Enamine deaminase RidA n=1 Tax=Amycolatopsis coloradensis TaxID=76021 RepID=A0A1R0KR79_9PSEU|nr:RidA family protein [Amycolatopsis coloradensis]OLZ50133.1 hypothetical protein BS329_20995 [Amycolatopsis coloradensis]
MGSRTILSSGTKTEQVFGYSRAVRAGDFIFVSGTTAMGPDGPVGEADIVAQSAECLRRIEEALAHFGAGLNTVVRTRVFVTDIDQWRRVGEAHSARFAEILPTTTIVGISALFDPRLLVEIEADAVLTTG